MRFPFNSLVMTPFPPHEVIQCVMHEASYYPLRCSFIPSTQIRQNNTPTAFIRPSHSGNKCDSAFPDLTASFEQLVGLLCENRPEHIMLSLKAEKRFREETGYGVTTYHNRWMIETDRWNGLSAVWREVAWAEISLNTFPRRPIMDPDAVWVIEVRVLRKNENVKGNLSITSDLFPVFTA